jgi:hypothetical protein
MPHNRGGRYSFDLLRASPYTSAHTSLGKGARRVCPVSPSETYATTFSTGLHLVWGRVVADIPDFCRELVAALAEG